MPRPYALAALALVSAMLTACSSSTSPSVTLWEGALAPVPPSSVSGQAAAVSQFGGIQASIEIRQATPGTTYRWRLAQGTCAAPGRVVGGEALYPVMAVDEDRTAQRQTTLPGELSNGGSYVTLVLRVGEGDVEERVACGALVQR